MAQRQVLLLQRRPASPALLLLHPVAVQLRLPWRLQLQRWYLKGQQTQIACRSMLVRSRYTVSVIQQVNTGNLKLQFKLQLCVPVPVHKLMKHIFPDIT